MFVRIRKAEIKDLNIINEIEEQFGEEAYSHVYFKRFITKGDNIFLVAEDDTGVRGYALALLRKNSEKCRLYSIAVHPNSKGKGIATSLLNSVLIEMTMSLKKSLTLEVSELNYPARSFYKKHGFKQTAEEPSYYKDGSKAIKMIKMLIPPEIRSLQTNAVEIYYRNG